MTWPLAALSIAYLALGAHACWRPHTDSSRPDRGGRGRLENTNPNPLEDTNP